MLLAPQAAEREWERGRGAPCRPRGRGKAQLGGEKGSFGVGKCYGGMASAGNRRGQKGGASVRPFFPRALLGRVCKMSPALSWNKVALRGVLRSLCLWGIKAKS